jgi:hypothetical protein
MSDEGHCDGTSALSEAKVADLARRLRSLNEGDVAVLDAIAMGAAAIGMLRELLFEKDRAGIFEPRRRAVQALAALNAAGVLKEFIASWRPSADPVERLGDEAVLSAAALALGASLDEEAFFVVFGIARKHPAAGVIEALGRSKRTESIPILIGALADDCAGVAAEEGLRLIGQQAVPALVDAALCVIMGQSGRETPSSIRRRRRVLTLVSELGASAEIRGRLRRLVSDRDDEVAALACRIGIAAADDAQVRECACRLVELLGRAAWPVRQEIEDCLTDNFAVAREFVDEALREFTESNSGDIERVRFEWSLRRVKARASSGHDTHC